MADLKHLGGFLSYLLEDEIKINAELHPHVPLISHGKMGLEEPSGGYPACCLSSMPFPSRKIYAFLAASSIFQLASLL